MPFTSSILGDLLVLCLLGVVGLHFWRLHSTGRLLLLDPLCAFWAGALVIYAGQPLSHGKTLIEWHGEGVFTATLFWSVFGLAMVAIGYEWNLAPRLGLRIPRCPQQLSPAKLSVAGCFFLLLGMAGYLYQFNSAGGLKKWLAVGRGDTDYANISGYAAQLADFLPVGVVILLFHVCFHGGSSLKKIAVWTLAGSMWLWFFYLGSRSRTIGFTILMLVCLYLPKRRNPSWALLCGLFAMLIVLTNFQRLYRENFTNLSFNLNQIDRKELVQLVLPSFLSGNSESRERQTPTGMEFNCAMCVVELVPDRVRYNFGYGHLEVFTRFIPRALWPGKIYPHMESVQGVLREADLTTAVVRDRDLLMGPAFAFIGHWYYVAGPLALLVGGLFTGILFRYIRSIYDESWPSQGNLILYSALIGIGFNEAVATPLLWLTNLPFTLAPLIVMLYVCRKTGDERPAFQPVLVPRAVSEGGTAE